MLMTNFGLPDMQIDQENAFFQTQKHSEVSVAWAKKNAPINNDLLAFSKVNEGSGEVAGWTNSNSNQELQGMDKVSEDSDDDSELRDAPKI